MNKPQRKPPHDLSVRLGDKKALKARLKRVASKNQISVNQLLILIIEWWLDAYEKDKLFTIELK